MPSRIWGRPVWAGDDLIFSPFQAAQYIRDRWPLVLEGDRLVARKAVQYALDGRICPDEARDAFETACKTVSRPTKAIAAG